jgi:UDP-N-acetyl-D-mannosaminuronic acid dehydrogenase
VRPDSQEWRSLYGSDLAPAAQSEAIRSGAVPVAVYGLGKMGLPLAAVFADVTGNTTGVDIDPAVVDAVNRGDCPVEGEPGLAELVAETVADDALDAESDPTRAAARATVHVVIVPTLVEDGQPDLSNLRTVAKSVASGLDPGDLVCIESTVPPRTCQDLLLPVLEEESDLTRSAFGLAFCPERTSSGRALQDIGGSYPKVVGGVDAESTRAAATLYDEVTTNDVHTVSDATTAECVKVFEGVYRDVNIALANELASMADELGIDVREAIDVANTQPYCDIHRPGPGVGGHCIPYYPYFLIEPFETETPVLETARAVNESMPARTVDILLNALGARGISPADASVLVLGVAYRPGVDEIRESPGLAIAELLERDGVTVLASDPVVDVEALDLQAVDPGDVPDQAVDAVVLATAHEEFDGIRWNVLEDVVLVDGRDAVDERAIDHPVLTLGNTVAGPVDRE